MSRSRWKVLAAIALFGSVTAACGVPTGDDTFSAIPPAEDPFGLDATSTSTSTTTTTSTTVPVAPDTIATTTTIVRLEPAEFYFLTTRNKLQPVVVDLPPPFSAEQIADILEGGPPEGLALTSLIEAGLIKSSNESRGVVTVDLDPTTFARIPTTRQTEAIGQIVMTMVRSLRGVGLVTFTIDGQPISVKKGNSLLSDVGEPLSYDDYVILLSSPPAGVTSTTTPTDASTSESSPTTVADP